MYKVTKTQKFSMKIKWIANKQFDNKQGTPQLLRGFH